MNNTDSLRGLVDEYDGRFRSSNSISIDRIWLTKEMWDRMRSLLTTADAQGRDDIKPNGFDAIQIAECNDLGQLRNWAGCMRRERDYWWQYAQGLELDLAGDNGANPRSNLQGRGVCGGAEGAYGNMQSAGKDALVYATHNDRWRLSGAVYAAMLAAAPAAQVADYSRSKEWCTKMAQQEPDCDISVGAPAVVVDEVVQAFERNDRTCCSAVQRRHRRHE